MHKFATMIKLLCVFGLVSLTTNAQPTWPPKINYFDQKITHFNFPTFFPTFKQRYAYEDKWYRSGGPILFYCGNEGNILTFWNNTGFMFEIAPKLNALIIFAEHRYYGTSLPFQTSFVQPFIQFLSIEEAMADYSALIMDLKMQFNAISAPVIAFGGSYGGMLAAYMRLKYSHVIHGAIAASAPMKWVSGETDLHPFFESIAQNMLEANSSCVLAIQSAYSMLLQKSQQGPEGFREISKSLRLCSPIQNNNDFDWMLRWSRNAFVMMSMANYPYENKFFDPLPAFPINVSCNRAVSESHPIIALREAIAVFYNSTPHSCFDYKSQYINCADITGCGLNNDAIAWDFQACTEMHLYDPVSKTSDLFPSLPLTLEDVNKHCKTQFGVQFAENQLSMIFGPSSVWKTTSNIVFSNGKLDPWMKGGILENLSESVTAIQIHGGAHHLDLRGHNEADPQSVKDARNFEFNQILKWIKAYEVK